MSNYGFASFFFGVSFICTDEDFCSGNGVATSTEGGCACKCSGGFIGANCDLRPTTDCVGSERVAVRDNCKCAADSVRDECTTGRYCYAGACHNKAKPTDCPTSETEALQEACRCHPDQVVDECRHGHFCWGTPSPRCHAESRAALEAHVAEAEPQEGEQGIGRLVRLKLTHDGSRARLRLSGPAGVWFGVGFDATAMEDEPYAIIVDGDGEVSERRMGPHSRGRPVETSVSVELSETNGDTRTVELTRAVAGASKDHFSFPTTSRTVPVIAAVGQGLRSRVGRGSAIVSKLMARFFWDFERCVRTKLNTRDMFL